MPSHRNSGDPKIRSARDACCSLQAGRGSPAAGRSERASGRSAHAQPWREAPPTPAAVAKGGAVAEQAGDEQCGSRSAPLGAGVPARLLQRDPPAPLVGWPPARVVGRAWRGGALGGGDGAPACPGAVGLVWRHRYGTSKETGRPGHAGSSGAGCEGDGAGPATA